MNLLKISNKLDNYCRYILDGATVGEYMVNHGFNHENVESIAKENSIKFDFAMLYYKFKGLEDYIYDFYENQFGSYGIDISGKFEYLINHETNLVIGDFYLLTKVRNTHSKKN